LVFSEGALLKEAQNRLQEDEQDDTTKSPEYIEAA
jgi:hypothetical protein